MGFYKISFIWQIIFFDKSFAFYKKIVQHTAPVFSINHFYGIYYALYTIFYVMQHIFLISFYVIYYIILHSSLFGI